VLDIVLRELANQRYSIGTCIKLKIGTHAFARCKLVKLRSVRSWRN
jgi:hypothetical protein